MGARWAVLGAALGGAAVGVMAGCIVVTGTSNGYSGSDASTPGQSCTSSAECAGQMCCYELAGSSLTAACAASCTPSFESCTQASDCGDGGSCIVQSCHVEAGGFPVTVSVTTCGVVSVCTQ
jgi:hypothetical protein